MNSLYSVAFINSLQRYHVNETLFEYNKVRVLLDFLLQSSIANYEDFVKCLKKSNQRLVAKVLETRVGELQYGPKRYRPYS